MDPLYSLRFLVKTFTVVSISYQGTLEKKTHTQEYTKLRENKKHSNCLRLFDG